MKKFILLSFGFLGWAFYEMSGGAAFTPASVQLAGAAEAETNRIVRVSETRQIAEAPAVAETPAPEVTRASVNLATLNDGLQPAARGDGNTEAGAWVSHRHSVYDPSKAAESIVLPSLITGTKSITPTKAVAEPAAPASEYRTVSGSRVNVREGPSTNYAVVGKLIEGDTVEVLEESDNGWVRMRSADSNQEGWMAGFLLDAG
jgi:uncharacterized protein YgiM (DUF1202 family)